MSFRSCSRTILAVRQRYVLSLATRTKQGSLLSSSQAALAMTLETLAGRRCFSSSPNEDDPSKPLVSTDSGKKDASSNSTSAIVYESPLGSVVGKLRSVSLLTAIVGAVGVPTMIAIKGGVAATGILAVALTFVTGTMGSTAAIHFIFGPYIYQMERIPVRVCSSPPLEENSIQNDEQLTETQSSTSKEPSTDNIALDGKASLLKATTKTLFLQKREIIFDPETDVTPYKGLRPMCNFEAKGMPLYVHPEFVYDDSLIKALQLKTKDEAQPMPSKENPDDFL